MQCNVEMWRELCLNKVYDDNQLNNKISENVQDSEIGQKGS